MAESGCVFLLFVLLLVTPSDSSDVVCQDVNATAGRDITLPCYLAPPSDVSKLTVEWTRDRRTVHLYRDWADNYDHQDQQFRGRTSLFHSEMKRGNISLKLTNVHQDDAGLYICYVPRLDSRVKTGNVLLTVRQKDPLGGDNETPGGGPTKDDWTGVIAGSVGVAAASLVLTVLAVIYFRRRRSGNHQSSPYNIGTTVEDRGPDRRSALGSVYKPAQREDCSTKVHWVNSGTCIPE